MKTEFKMRLIGCCLLLLLALLVCVKDDRKCLAATTEMTEVESVVTGVEIKENDLENKENLFEIGIGTETEEYMGELPVAAFCGCPKCLGNSGTRRTYSGKLPIAGKTVAADLSLFSIGEQVKIGDKRYEVEDKITKGAKEKVSVYFENHEEAIAFGRQTLPIYRIKTFRDKNGISLGMFETTGYCSCEMCVGKKEEVLTKSETVPMAGHTIAVDPQVIPQGTVVDIDGVLYVAEDTGKLVQGNIIDIYFDTHEEAVNFGRQMKEVYLVQTVH